MVTEVPMSDDKLIERLRATADGVETILREIAGAKNAGVMPEIIRQAADRLDDLERTLARVQAALDHMTPFKRSQQRKAIQDSIKAGLSLRRAAKKHGVGVGVVRGVIARMGGRS